MVHAIKMKNPGIYDSIILFPGELHFRMHSLMAIFKIFYDSIIGPINDNVLKYKSIFKDFASNRYNRSQTLLLVITNGIFN